METETKKKRNKAGANIVLPPPELDQWTMKQAHALNPQLCHASVYHRVKYLQSEGKIVVCGTMKLSRGKPRLLYRFATEYDVSSKPAEVVADQDLPADLPF